MIEDDISQQHQSNPQESEVKERQPTIPYEDFWINVRLWENFRTELQFVHDHSLDRFQQLVDKVYDAAPVSLVINILLSAFEIRFNQVLSSQNREQIDAVEQEGRYLISEARILAQVANVQADFLLEKSKQENVQLDLHTAIAKIVKMVRPAPPVNWPPKTEEEQQALRRVDSLTTKHKSDGLADTEISVCRQSNILTMDMYRLRGLKPFGCVVSIENDNGERSGHMLTVIAEQQQGQMTYVFVDGHNGRTDSGFEAFSHSWRNVGWNIVSCEASRFVEKPSTEGTVSPGGVWEVIKFSE